ncbi:MAG: hypothetical protein ACYTXF_33330 [Nostoc sp.]
MKTIALGLIISLLLTALPAIMQYSFSPCPVVSKLSDLGMYLIAAVSAVTLLAGQEK